MEKKLEIERAFDGEFYVLGEHISIEIARKLLSEYDDELEVENIEKVYVRHGILPSDIQEEENQHGWWVVEKTGRGVGKASCILVKRKKEERCK